MRCVPIDLVILLIRPRLLQFNAGFCKVVLLDLPVQVQFNRLKPVILRVSEQSLDNR